MFVTKYAEQAVVKASTTEQISQAVSVSHSFSEQIVVPLPDTCRVPSLLWQGGCLL